MKKRIVAFFLAAVLSVGVIACGTARPGVELTGGQSVEMRESGSEEGKQQTGKVDRTAKDGSDGNIKEFFTGLFAKDDASDAEPGAEQNQAFYPEAEMCEDMAGFRSGATGMPAVKSEMPMLEWNTEEYNYVAENSWRNVKTSPFSTFAADVDTASYANVRRMLTRGQEVPVDAVRLEEMINYFHYDYPQPKAGEPFSVTTEMAPCPWNENSRLLLVGLSAKELDTGGRPASNLVFLIDVSGSMDGADRLGLVQRSFKLLCEELQPGDRVSIVTYASSDKVVLDGATGEDRAKICEAIEDLFASGGTNGSAGIQTAYELAEKYFIEGGNNRVILATDGDLNIGVTDQGSLTRLIEEKAKSGVFLSVLGFGWGNLSDARMEALADHGNGNYSYIDSISEARKVLIEEMGGTLFTVAKDVKLQVEFHPEMVKGYRLIGYENRTMVAEDFADDTKDGGEIGAGHQVTALYEVALKGSKQEIPEVESRYGSREGVEDAGFTAASKEYLAVNVRYKEPDGDESKLLVYPVGEESYCEQMSDNLSWAAGVAQAGMLLKKSEFAGTSEMKSVLERMARTDAAGSDEYRKEFLYLFSRANINEIHSSSF